MTIPFEKVFKWLSADCHHKQWCNEWKAREQTKDDQQKKLDQDYYWACEERRWDTAKRRFDQGATNDYISDSGTTSFICLYTFEQKEMIAEVIQKHPQEYERSMEVLSAVQRHYSAKIRAKLEPICQTELWMKIWRGVELRSRIKNLDQLAKDAALYIACYREFPVWELATRWIDRGATNTFINQPGQTALHWAAYKGSSQIVERILDRFQLEIDRKDEDFQSPLCYAFEMDHYDIAEIMMKKNPKYPIMQLMLNGGYINMDIDKGLSIINNWTDLEEQLKTDFEFIKMAKLTGNSRIIGKMADLIEVCETKYNISLTKVIQQTFGKKMVVHDELTWRYENGSKKSFVASYFKDLKITEDVTLTKIMGNVAVNTKHTVCFCILNY